jgi:hypothetical protein
VPPEHVNHNSARQRNQSGDDLSDREDHAHSNSTELERALNIWKEHEEALQPPVENGVPARKAWNYEPASVLRVLGRGGRAISSLYVECSSK